RPEHADIELAAVGQVAVGLVVLRIHAAASGIEPPRDSLGIQLGHELARIGYPVLAALVQGDFRRHERDAARSPDDACRPSPRVLFYPAVRWIRRRSVYFRRPERGAVEIAVLIDGLEHDRIFGRDPVELCERESPRLVVELLLRPSSQRS